MTVALSPAEWEIVSGILSPHLPAPGSGRATNAIEGPPLSPAARIDLAEAFDESDLPFKVDIVEADSLEPEFRSRIESDKVLLEP